MAVTTVAQLAAELNRPASTLLEQLQAAGVKKATAEDTLNESDKERLLDHLRTAHGTGGAERKKITLTRKSTSEIKQADASGKARTIQVEVRKKRVFVKREDGVDEAAAAAAEEAELKRREEEAQAQAEALRQQEEELARKMREREDAERAAREAEEKRREEERAAREAAEQAAAEAAAKAAAEAEARKVAEAAKSKAEKA
ncbi:translation initiation factor IF-2 associated domain-containing protein, partial [Mitsuaria sp. GD03876]|uniref:translation initiation factor IF-2 associated domain-containing protein n=1 Tax=Mitsuaria sp. GD03876 TaxID=2975399 RepID=UPI00244D60B4